MVKTFLNFESPSLTQLAPCLARACVPHTQLCTFPLDQPMMNERQALVFFTFYAVALDFKVHAVHAGPADMQACHHLLWMDCKPSLAPRKALHLTTLSITQPRMQIQRYPALKTSSKIIHLRLLRSPLEEHKLAQTPRIPCSAHCTPGQFEVVARVGELEISKQISRKWRRVKWGLG